MKTTSQIFEESLDRIDSIEAINGITEEILKITDALRSKELKNWTGDQISRAISNLAVLRVNLAQNLADAMATYDISYLNRKMIYASQWKANKDHLNAINNKVTVGDIDAQTLEDIAEDQQEEIKNKHYAERLRLMYDATGTLIMALQSRLNILKQERVETNYQK